MIFYKHKAVFLRMLRGIPVAGYGKPFDRFHICNVVFCKKTDHLSSGHFGLRGLYLYFSVLQHAKDAGNKPDIRRQERFDGFAVFPGGQV